MQELLVYELGDMEYVFDINMVTIFRKDIHFCEKLEDILWIDGRYYQVNCNNLDEKSRMLYKPIVDYSNYIHIDKLYIDDLTELCMCTIEKIWSKLHFNGSVVSNRNLELVDLYKDACSIDGINSKYQKVDFFWGKIVYGPRCMICQEDIDNISEILNELEMLSLKDKKSGIINSCQYICDIYRMIEMKEKKYNSCMWGIDRLYVDKLGHIYNCVMACKKGIEKNINEIGLYYIVDEYKECNACPVRYLCGGRCAYSSVSNDVCNVIRRMLEIVIEKYIIDNYIV